MHLSSSYLIGHSTFCCTYALHLLNIAGPLYKSLFVRDALCSEDDLRDVSTFAEALHSLRPVVAAQSVVQS